MTKMYIYIICVVMALVGCGGDYSEVLPGEYAFNSESRYDQVIFSAYISSNYQVIPCSVEDYSYNSQFIVARQQVVKDCIWEKYIKIDQNEGDEAYWIIIVEQQNLIGPMSLSEYLNKRKDLGIPDEVRLERG